MKAEKPPRNYGEAREKLIKEGQHHPSRRKHLGWEVKPLPLESYPKKPEPIDTLVVSLRLTGMPPRKIGQMIGRPEKEVREILRPWGPTTGGVFSVFPEYVPGLGLPDYLPLSSPDLEGLTYNLVTEAEDAAKKECDRLGISFERKRRQFVRRHS